MKKIITLLVAMFVFISGGLSQFILYDIIVDGEHRSYKLYVPEIQKDMEPTPLVLNFHGFLGDMDFQAMISGMNNIADNHKFFVAYPQGKIVQNIVSATLPPAGPGWNTGLPFFQTTTDDITFIQTVIEDIKTRYEIDESRIYATGFSLGGDMSIRLACEMADVFAAVAPVGGSHPNIEFCDPARPIPIFYTNGTADVIVPYYGGAPGIPTSIPEAIDFWLDNNKCSNMLELYEVEDIDATDNSTVSEVRYFDCIDDIDVWLNRIEGGGHWWPGGSDIPPGFEFFGPVNRDINASEEIWNFFMKYNLQGLVLSDRDIGAESHVNVYPSPFNLGVNIDFEAGNSNKTDLRMYDLLGKEIAVLINNEELSGFQSVKWDSSENHLESGIYVYRLMLDEKVITGTIVKI